MRKLCWNFQRHPIESANERAHLFNEGESIYILLENINVKAIKPALDSPKLPQITLSTRGWWVIDGPLYLVRPFVTCRVFICKSQLSMRKMGGGLPHRLFKVTVFIVKFPVISTFIDIHLAYTLFFIRIKFIKIVEAQIPENQEEFPKNHAEARISLFL